MDKIAKIPPQALDLEEAILGSMILENESFDRVCNIISPKSFYKHEHQLIASAIFEMHSNNKMVDLLTLSNQLKTSGKLEEVGGSYYISLLSGKITQTTNIEEYAKTVQEKYLAREIIRLTSEFSRKAYSDTTDVFALLTEALLAFSKLTGFNRSNIRHISETLKDLQAQIDFNLNNEFTITGIPTGFTEFDIHSGGLQKGDLIVIAGETSNGKTSLALNIVLNAAKRNYKCALYSCEMTDRQLAARMMAGEAGISGKAIQYYKLNEFQLDKISRGMASIEKLPIYIDEMESLRYDYLERSIRSMVLREGIELIVVDYLQLLQSTDGRKDNKDAMAEIANALKSLARTLKVPIILISQLTRDKLNPKPTLGRLKGSGDIENAADIAWLVWLPEKYGYKNFDCKMQNYQAEGLAHHIIAKGRNIGTTEFVSRFDGKITKFSNYAGAEMVSNDENPY